MRIGPHLRQARVRHRQIVIGRARIGRDHGAVEVIDRAADQPVADVRDGLFPTRPDGHRTSAP